jgi:hypothetical protein
MMASQFLLLLFSPSKLWLWESCEIIGAIIVTIGVIGEYVATFTRIPKGRIAKKKWEKHSTLILIFGLAIELIGLVSTISLSSIEIADLEKQTASLQATNLLLRTKLDELEIRLQPRRITMEQARKFMFLTERVEKIPIKIVIGEEGRDTETFAGDLREMFTDAGFKTNADAGMWGITRIPEFHLKHPLGGTNELPDVIFVRYSPTHEIYLSPYYTAEQTNGVLRPIVSTTNQYMVFEALGHAFQEIGMNYDWWANTSLVNSGECLILVPIK